MTEVKTPKKRTNIVNKEIQGDQETTSKSTDAKPGYDGWQ